MYDGSFSEGVRDGQGVMVYAVDGSSLNYTYNAGDRYSGEWKDDKRHGSCTYTFFNGETGKFTWSEDVSAEFSARQSAILAASHSRSTEVCGSALQRVRPWLGLLAFALLLLLSKPLTRGAAGWGPCR